MILVGQTENNWLTLASHLGPKNAIYGTALARLCNWNKIDRNLVNKRVSHLNIVVDIAFCDEITNWLYAFTSTIENENQEYHYIVTLLSCVVQV